MTSITRLLVALTLLSTYTLPTVHSHSLIHLQHHINTRHLLDTATNTSKNQPANANTTSHTQQQNTVPAAAGALMLPLVPTETTTQAETTATQQNSATTSNDDSVDPPNTKYSDIKDQWTEATDPVTTTTQAPAKPAAPITPAEPVVKPLCTVQNVVSIIEDNKVNVSYDIDRHDNCDIKQYMIQYSTDDQFKDMNLVSTQPIDNEYQNSKNKPGGMIDTLIPTLTYYIRVVPFDSEDTTITGTPVTSYPSNVTLQNNVNAADGDSVGYQVTVKLNGNPLTQSADALTTAVQAELNTVISVDPSQITSVTYDKTDNTVSIIVIPGTGTNSKQPAVIAEDLRLQIQHQTTALKATTILKNAKLLTSVQTATQCANGRVWAVDCSTIDATDEDDNVLEPPNTSNNDEIDNQSLPVGMSGTQQDNNTPDNNSNTDDDIPNDNKQDDSNNNNKPGKRIPSSNDSNSFYDRDTGLIFGLNPLLLFAMVGGIALVGGYAFVTRIRSRPGYSAVSSNTNNNTDIYDENAFNDDIEMAVTKPTRAAVVDSSSDIEDSDDLALNMNSGNTYTDKLVAISENADNSAIQLAECVMSNLSIPSYGHTTYTKKLIDQDITTIQQLKTLTSNDYKTLNLPFVIEDAIKKAIQQRDTAIQERTNSPHTNRPRTSGLSLSKPKPVVNKPKKILAAVVDDTDDDFGLNMNGSTNTTNHTTSHSNDWGDLDLELNTTQSVKSNGNKKPSTKKSGGKSKILVAEDYGDDLDNSFEDF